MRPLFPLMVAALAALAACTPSVQTTSGAEYVAARPGLIDQDIREVASVEPDLTFPARIGLARVVNGQITTAPPEEAALFADFAERHAALGSFVPVSPLIEGMVNGDRASPVINRLRRAAARQHLDYVLVYELGARSRGTTDTPFALADVTLIGGAILPTRINRVTGLGSAIFVDVRNGYPYGTASASEDLSGLARSFGTSRARQNLRDRATTRVARKLLPQVDEMLTELAARAR